MNNITENLELAIGLVSTLKRLNKFIGKSTEDNLPVVDASYLDEIEVSFVKGI